MNPSNLFQEIPKCAIFAKGHPSGQGVKESRLDELLIQILESMHASESLLFEGMLKKKLKVKGLTAKMALEAIPDLYRKV